VIDPPDGKIPFTPEAQQRVAAMRRWSDSGMGDSYEDRPVADRCLQGFNSGPPMTPGQYNNATKNLFDLMATWMNARF